MTDPSEKQPPETPTRQALRTETRGLIVIALAIFIFYLVRYFHLAHGSAH